jgi:hypothetical protein
LEWLCWARQLASAFASFCARVSGLGFTVLFDRTPYFEFKFPLAPGPALAGTPDPEGGGGA